MAEAVGNSSSTAELIRNIGDDSIGRAWGWSYYTAAGLYTVCYASVIFCFVAGICGLEESKRGSRSRTPRKTRAV
jgi:hypothetical protein